MCQGLKACQTIHRYKITICILEQFTRNPSKLRCILADIFKDMEVILVKLVNRNSRVNRFLAMLVESTGWRPMFAVPQIGTCSLWPSWEESSKEQEKDAPRNRRKMLQGTGERCSKEQEKDAPRNRRKMLQGTGERCSKEQEKDAPRNRRKMLQGTGERCSKEQEKDAPRNRRKMLQGTGERCSKEQEKDAPRNRRKMLQGTGERCSKEQEKDAPRNRRKMLQGTGERCSKEQEKDAQWTLDWFQHQFNVNFCLLIGQNKGPIGRQTCVSVM